MTSNSNLPGVKPLKQTLLDYLQGDEFSTLKHSFPKAGKGARQPGTDFAYLNQANGAPLTMQLCDFQEPMTIPFAASKFQKKEDEKDSDAFDTHRTVCYELTPFQLKALQEKEREMKISMEKRWAEFTPRGILPLAKMTFKSSIHTESADGTPCVPYLSTRLYIVGENPGVVTVNQSDGNGKPKRVDWSWITRGSRGVPKVRPFRLSFKNNEYRFIWITVCVRVWPAPPSEDNFVGDTFTAEPPEQMEIEGVPDKPDPPASYIA